LAVRDHSFQRSELRGFGASPRIAAMSACGRILVFARSGSGQELLNGCFGSVRGVSQALDAGFFVYEAMPHGDRKPGITGRGPEGLTDSVLNVLGV
jgi:hypothetical protein